MELTDKDFAEIVIDDGLDNQEEGAGDAGLPASSVTDAADLIASVVAVSSSNIDEANLKLIKGMLRDAEATMKKHEQAITSIANALKHMEAAISAAFDSQTALLSKVNAGVMPGASAAIDNDMVARIVRQAVSEAIQQSELNAKNGEKVRGLFKKRFE